MISFPLLWTTFSELTCANRQAVASLVLTVSQHKAKGYSSHFSGESCNGSSGSTALPQEVAQFQQRTEQPGATPLCLGTELESSITAFVPHQPTLECVPPASSQFSPLPSNLAACQLGQRKFIPVGWIRHCLGFALNYLHWPPQFPSWHEHDLWYICYSAALAQATSIRPRAGLDSGFFCYTLDICVHSAKVG